MDKTPKGKSIQSRAPATVGKMLKQSAVASKKFEVSEGSTSIVSSICTPIRIFKTSSFEAKIANNELPLLLMQKKQVNISLVVEGSENSKYDTMPMVQKEIDTASVKSPVKSIGKKSQRYESTIAIENNQSLLNRTFEVESAVRENLQEMIVKSKSNQKSYAETDIIDLTESPEVKNISTFNNAVSPLANFLDVKDENTIPLNDTTFTEDNDKGDIPAKDKTFSPKPTSSQTPMKLKFLQFKTKMKKTNTKPISIDKEVKIAEVDEDLVKEIKKTDSKLQLSKIGRSEQVKSTLFRFGAAQKVRAFDFNLKGTKIPTLNLKELKRKNENEEHTSKSVTKSQIKSIPNFKAIHERIFEKDLPIDEIENHKMKRAKMIESGRKFSEQEIIAKSTEPKSKRKLEMNMVQPKTEQSKPLSNVNMNSRAKLNPEQREERRKMMFKQGGMVHRDKVIIKGVRTNRRFDLMMEQRLKK